MHSLNTGAVQDVNVFGALIDFGRLCFGFWGFFFSRHRHFLKRAKLADFQAGEGKKSHYFAIFVIHATRAWRKVDTALEVQMVEAAEPNLLLK